MKRSQLLSLVWDAVVTTCAYVVASAAAAVAGACDRHPPCWARVVSVSPYGRAMTILSVHWA